MKRAPLIPERAVSRMLQSATEALRGQDYDQYFQIMERASRLAPGNPAILLDMGRAYGMRFNYQAAEQAFERAVRVAAQKSEALAMAALHCRDFARYEMSARYLQRASQQPDASPDTFVKLAEIYERLRRLPEAEQAVNRALQLDPSSALALLVRARLDRLSGRLEDAERTVRPFLGRTDANTWSTRIRGWYELGAILDRAGQFDEAMAAFLQAKALIIPNAAKSLAAERSAQAKLKQVELSLSHELIERWRSAAELAPARKLAVLCGHPRSGTTLLEQVLDSHPQVVSAEETTIFLAEAYMPLRRGVSNDAPIVPVLDAVSAGNLRNSRDNYFRLMELFLGSPIDSRLLIDKNPSLTGLIPAILRVFPEAKLLVALRDPRDVCMSCFMQPLPLNQVSATFLTLEDTVQEYASLMGLWQAIMQYLPDGYLQVRYEDMVQDLETTARRTLEFLGLTWDSGVLRFDEHAREKTVRSPTYADVTKPVFKGAVGRWRNYQKYLDRHLEKLQPFVQAFGYE